MNQTFLHRYIWVYLTWDVEKGEGELSTWVSPDKYGCHLDTIATPFEYHLTRNQVRYIMRSEVQLKEATAVRIAGNLYDTEFVIDKTIARKRSRR